MGSFSLSSILWRGPPKMPFELTALGSQFLVGLSRAMILFIVTSGLSFVLGVLRVLNVAHGSLYMIGAFSAYAISRLLGGGGAGFWLGLVLSPFVVALVSLLATRHRDDRVWHGPPGRHG